jgi:AraC-like DNA-binding protein/TolB-like protein/Tfp pilus assembly protein PilF
MAEPQTNNKVFIRKLTDIILANLSNENFGVKELAQESRMSQKSLRRKLYAFSKKTVNQLIREVRLQKAFEILKNEEITASEVAYKVGFGSPAYFNTCFHKYFGYPPGKVVKNYMDNQDLNFQTESGVKNRKRKSALRTYILSVPGIILLAVSLGTIGFLLYKKFHKSDLADNLISSDGRISMAVMPFQNMTNDTIWDMWQDVIQNEIITFLTNYEELKLKQSESISGILKSQGITTYASLTPSLAGIISKKLDANVFLYGNIIRAGPTLRVNAQLINTKTKVTYKSFQIEGTAKEEFIFRIIDSLSLQVKNYLLISVSEKELLPDERRITSTKSPDAYRDYVNGLKAFLKSDFPTAVDYYSHALTLDSNFTMAASDMSYAYAYMGRLDLQRKWSLWLYKKKDMMPPLQKIFVEYSYANNFGTPYEALKCLKRLEEYDDKGINCHFLLGQQYLELDQFSQAIVEFEKNLETLTKIGPKSAIDWDYSGLGLAYHKAGRYKNEKKLYNRAEKYFPESSELIYRQAVLSLTEGDTLASNRYVEKYRSIQKNNAVSEADILTKLGEMYSEAKCLHNAEDNYRMALSREPDNPVRIKNLSYFLVDRECGIDEGMAFADAALKSKPDDFEFLQIKGWGLYKQGSQQQALELLQKSWDLRTRYSVYDHTAYLHLEEVKKSITNTK